MADSYYETLYNDAIAAIGKAKQKAREQIEGQAAGLLREGEAGIALGKERYGDVVAQALAGKMRGKFKEQLASRIAGLESDYMKQLAGLQAKKGEAMTQEKIARDVAQTGMWGNIFGGLGSLAGIFFPPAGAAKTALDVVGGAGQRTAGIRP